MTITLRHFKNQNKKRTGLPPFSSARFGNRSISCPPYFTPLQNEALLQRFTIILRIKHTILFASHLIIYAFYRGKKLVQRIVFRHYSCI